jgi:outer membrane PBP1 activator LpoA protein
MGVDAYRLHARLAQMANFPGISIPGATGVLSMRNDGSIAREVLGARIVDGTVELLPNETAPAMSVSQVIQGMP